MRIYDTLIPYKVIRYRGIQYTVCRDYPHISRYRNLRQVVHEPNNLTERFITLETPNAFQTQGQDVIYYEVDAIHENRLDLVAQETLGSARYSWVISYFNRIEDGFTIREGQKLVIPKNFTSLFNKGSILAPINPFTLNLGSE